MALSARDNVVSADRQLIESVATRWIFRADCRIANDLVEWTERQSARSLTGKDYTRELAPVPVLKLRPDDSSFTPQVTLEEETFADAKASVVTMLPRLLAALEKKFRDKFYTRATQQRFKLYLYFSGEPALETIALTLTLKNGKPFLWLAYIPNKLLGGADFAHAIQQQVLVADPEMAGLALMRLVRSLLARVW